MKRAFNAFADRLIDRLAPKEEAAASSAACTTDYGGCGLWNCWPPIGRRVTRCCNGNCTITRECC